MAEFRDRVIIETEVDLDAKTFGEIEDTVKELRKEIKGLVPGTEEFNAAAQRLGQAQNVLKQQKKAIKDVGKEAQLTYKDILGGALRDGVQSINQLKAAQKALRNEFNNLERGSAEFKDVQVALRLVNEQLAEYRASVRGTKPFAEQLAESFKAAGVAANDTKAQFVFLNNTLNDLTTERTEIINKGAVQDLTALEEEIRSVTAAIEQLESGLPKTGLDFAALQQKVSNTTAAVRDFGTKSRETAEGVKAGFEFAVSAGIDATAVQEELTAATNVFIAVQQAEKVAIGATAAAELAATVAKRGLVAATKAASAAARVFNAILSANPISLIIVAVGALVAALITFRDRLGVIGEFIGAVFETIGDVIGGVIDGITTGVEAARDALSFLTFGLLDDTETAAKKRAEIEENLQRDLAIKRRESAIEELALAEGNAEKINELQSQNVADEIKRKQFELKQKTKLSQEERQAIEADLRKLNVEQKRLSKERIKLREDESRRVLELQAAETRRQISLLEQQTNSELAVLGQQQKLTQDRLKLVEKLRKEEDARFESNLANAKAELELLRERNAAIEETLGANVAASLEAAAEQRIAQIERERQAATRLAEEEADLRTESIKLNIESAKAAEEQARKRLQLANDEIDGQVALLELQRGTEQEVFRAREKQLLDTIALVERLRLTVEPGEVEALNRELAQLRESFRVEEVARTLEFNRQLEDLEAEREATALTTAKRGTELQVAEAELATQLQLRELERQVQDSQLTGARLAAFTEAIENQKTEVLRAAAKEREALLRKEAARAAELQDGILESFGGAAGQAAAAQNRAARARAAAELEISSEQERAAAILAINLQLQAELLAIEQQARQARFDAEFSRTGLFSRFGLQQEFFSDTIEATAAFYDRQLELAEGNADLQVAIEEEKNRRLAELEQQRQLAALDTINQISAAVIENSFQFADDLDALLDAANEARIADLEAELGVIEKRKAVEQEALGEVTEARERALGVRSTQLNREVAAQQAALEKELAAERKAIREREALERAAQRRQKAIDIARAIAETAKAVVAALANPPGPPFSIPQAAAAAAFGALQVATIARQKFEQGGIFRRGLKAAKQFAAGGLFEGLTEGPRHSDGGIKLVDGKTGRVQGEIEGGETILTRRVAQNPRLFRMAAEINAAAGGINFAARAPQVATRGVFELGGVVAGAGASFSEADRLAQAVVSLGADIRDNPPVLELRELTERQERIQVLETNRRFT